LNKDGIHQVLMIEGKALLAEDDVLPLLLTDTGATLQVPVLRDGNPPKGGHAALT